MHVSEAIKARFSPRKFTKDIISSDQLAGLFQAIQDAPSCFNEQPWRIFYANKNENLAFYEKLLELLMPANREWAKDAPVIMITAVSKIFKRNGKNNAHCRHDLGLAMGQMGLAAVEKGFALHQMAGFDAQKAKEVLYLPENWEAVTAVALGVALPEEISQAPSKHMRIDLDQIVFNSPLL